MGIEPLAKAARFGAGMLLGWALTTSPVMAIPEIQHWQTDNGARVYFVPAPELPMVDIRVVFAAGSARDGEHHGLAQMTSQLLDKGAAGLSADEIAAQAEGLGAELGTGSLRDMAWVTLRSLSYAGQFEPAVELLVKVLSQPDFRQQDLDRERQRSLVALRLSDQQPGKIAGYRFFEAVYGEHPYAHRPIGSAESLEQLTVSQIRKFYRRHYVARNAVVAIVGNLQRQEAERLAERVAGKLAVGEPAPGLPVVPPLAQADEVRIGHPSKQTHVRMGAPGMHRGDADYFPLYVGNHILGGGGLVSRLHDEIREKRGLSYSVYSSLSPMAQDGPYTFSLQTRNDQVAEALGVLRATLEKFHSKGPTEEELIAAKKNITGGFALRVDSNSKIVEYLAMIGYYDLPLDYLETFNDKVMAVSGDDIRDAFQRRVHPQKMVTVIVGGDS